MIFPDANGGWVNLQQISLRFQTQELQDKVNVLGGARDFKGLETVSSSGSFHVPSHPLVVPSFSRTSRRDKSPLESQRAHLLLPQNRAAELEKPELSRIGNRRSLQKSDDGSDSQRRGAHKRRGNSVCQRIGFLRDSEASRGYAHVWTSGQKPHLIKNVRKNNATRRVTCLSLFQACQTDFPARLRVHPQHRNRRTQCEMVPRHVQQSHKVGVNAVGHWETSGEIPKKPKTKKKATSMEHGKPVAWSAGMVGGIHWWSDGTRSFCTKWRTHKHLSWTASSGTSDESDIGQAQHFYAFPERPKVRSLQEDQIYKGPSQKTHWQIKYLEQKILGDLITAWSSQWGMCESRHNHRYAVVMQDLASQWLQSYPCKTESSEETEKSLQKFLEPTAKPRGTFAYNSLAFDKSLEELSWNHCASNGIAGRAVPRMKERTCAVLCRSTFDEKWWANSMECYCCVRNVQDYLSDGKTPHERRFGQPFSGPKIPVGLVIEYHPSSAKETPPVW